MAPLAVTGGVLLAGAVGFLAGWLWSRWPRIRAEMLTKSDRLPEGNPIEIMRLHAGHDQSTGTWVSKAFTSGLWMNRGESEHEIPFAPGERCTSLVVASSAPVAYALTDKPFSRQPGNFSRLLRVCLPGPDQPLGQVRVEEVPVPTAPGWVSRLESISADGERLIAEVLVMRELPGGHKACDHRTYRFRPNEGGWDPIQP